MGDGCLTDKSWTLLQHFFKILQRQHLNTHVAAALIWCEWAAQVRGAGSKSGTLEKAMLEAHAARTLAEGSYQDARFSLPPGFLGGATGSRPHHLYFCLGHYAFPLPKH